MILTLVREQVRAQRAALVWTALVLAAAVGFSTYASVTGTAHAAVTAYQAALSPKNAPHGAFVELTDLGNDRAEATGFTATTTAALARELERSNAAGSDATASFTRLSTVANSPDPDAGASGRYWRGALTATWGATPWDALLAEGHAPGKGEIALSSSVARDLDVGIGDTVTVIPDFSPGMDDVLLTAKVSGLTYDIDGQQLPWRDFSLYINGADAPILTGLDAPPGDGWSGPVASVGWSTPDDALEPQWRTAWEQRGGPALMDPGAPAPWLVAITLTLGAIVMAFAVGRAQAATRVRWTATARALGARRSHLMGAGAVEAAALFATSLVGVALGYLAATGDHAIWRSSLVAPPPVGVRLPWWLFAALVGLALTLAATSAAIPAVLATRVPPTAALKATAATDEHEFSRRVRALPVGIALAISCVALLVPASSNEAAVIKNSVALAGAVLLTAFVIEMTRRGAESLGRRWQRAARPWQVYAGTMLGGHPRQASALASIHFFALFGVAGWFASAGPLPIGRYASYLWGGRGGPFANLAEMASNPAVLALISTLLAVGMLCAAIIASSFRAATAERELAGALGLQHRDVRRAHAFTWTAAQGAGAILGAIAGSTLIGGISASQSALSVWGVLNYQVGDRIAAFAVSMLVALAAATLAFVLSSSIAAWATSTSSPGAQRLVEVTS